MQQITKTQFAWLYEHYFRKFKHKCWHRTVRQKSKRGKYYVPDKWAELVKEKGIY